MRFLRCGLITIAFFAVGAAPAAAGGGGHGHGHGGPGGHGGGGAPFAVTEQGAVRGFTADGVQKFLGLPYAAPPVGRLRWRAPQPAARCRGVRAATTLPPACPQTANTTGPRSETEDCLYLSVYRPLRGSHLPVLFWIHGGGPTTGTGNQHDGALMARTNGIVVVSINYRLGPLGFLALPDGTANFGLLDQRAAMQWTARNIRAFGGDPRNVTIAGESAGGFSVCSALAAPSERGLFAPAVMQSGPCLPH